MGSRILMVEDDHTLAEVLGMKLSQLGHEFSLASNQRDAYHLLDDQEFDFALLDLRLPTHDRDMDPNSEVGFDILDHIRERYSQSELPVIVMTAYEESSQTAVRALKAGATDYITKPFADSAVSIDDKLAAIGRLIHESTGVPVEPSKHKIVLGGKRITINEIEVNKDCFFELLLLLGRRTLLSDGEPMTGREIAKAMGIEAQTVRTHVSRFRKWITEVHEKQELAPIGEQDIIENRRKWKGYRLNLDTCFISSQ